MLRHRCYYLLKPIVPWRLRMGVRRIFARRKRQAHQAVWPINPAAARAPAGWRGWPDHKKFAFVLTHDVEGPDGLAKCRRLAELELSLGFRSSFNFIPEGPYRVTAELRHWLVQNGFEVGVHDLAHNGKLFQSHRGFQRAAPRINEYVREWKTVGFRAGFMLRNLDWVHDLDVQYDASTFDTDPFEPQSDGAHTIFPFWIPAPAAGASAGNLTPSARSRGGYIELPYTLPQDSTLFLLLQESSPRIWLDKADWIAANQGMALVNVHPDYLRFDDEPSSPRTFTVEHYLKLLRHVRDRYPGEYWQPLARDLAAHARSQYGIETAPAAR